MPNAYFLYAASRWLFVHHIPLLPRLIELLIFLIYNSKIPYQATIGKGTKFAYGAMGVVIHNAAIIGTDCFIAQQVTIGGGNRHFPGVPRIGNNVAIAKGAVIMGGITVGDNAFIGANAVVNQPVPANAIVAGVPARILRYRDAESTQTVH